MFTAAQKAEVLDFYLSPSEYLVFEVVVFKASSCYVFRLGFSISESCFLQGDLRDWVVYLMFHKGCCSDTYVCDRLICRLKNGFFCSYEFDGVSLSASLRL